MSDPSRWGKLSRIARSRATPGPAAQLTLDPSVVAASSVLTTGIETRTSRGVYWRIEETVVAPPWMADARDALALSGLGPSEQGVLDALERPALENTLFWDLETCGFSGNPLFLSGWLEVAGQSATFVQCLARTYAEEAAVIQATLHTLNAHCLLVSFNGKSYDLPFFRDRAARHGLQPPRVEGHIDLLHAARRRWSGSLPDCRLKTLEQHLGAGPRIGDPPGREVPERYHRYVKTGAVSQILPVLRHNLLDLATLPTVLGALARSEPAGASANLQWG